MNGLAKAIEDIEKGLKGLSGKKAKEFIYSSLKPFRKSHNIKTQFLIDSSRGLAWVELYKLDEDMDMPIHYFCFKDY